MYLNDVCAASSIDKSNMFAKHFSSVFDNCAVTVPQLEEALNSVPRDVLSMDTFSVSELSVISATKSIKSSFSPGPGIIPAVILKQCSDILAVPLTRLFNFSLQQHNASLLLGSNLVYFLSIRKAINAILQTIEE